MRKLTERDVGKVVRLANGIIGIIAAYHPRLGVFQIAPGKQYKSEGTTYDPNYNIVEIEPFAEYEE